MKLLYRITNLILLISFLVACTPETEKMEQQARERMQVGKFAEAVSLLNEIIKMTNAEAAIFNMRGAAFYNLNENAKALTDFDQAISMDSSNYQFYYNRGNVKRTLNRPESAIEDYTNALQIKNNEYEIYLNRALSFVALREVPAALNDFKQAENLCEGKDASIFFYRGKLNMNIEAFEEALIDFNKTIDIQPKNGEAYLGRALSKINLEGKASEESCADIIKSEQFGFIGAAEFKEEYCK
jgi:tetratricopeptide (TPR) repeat protein